MTNFLPIHFGEDQFKKINYSIQRAKAYCNTLHKKITNNKSAINTVSMANASNVKDVVLAEEFDSQIAYTETMSSWRQIDQGFGKDQWIRGREVKLYFSFDSLSKTSRQFD